MTKIHRAEVVGSLLRTDDLKEARRAVAANELSALDFKHLEDKAVDDAVELQEKIGVDNLTDGELRRSFFCDHVMTALDGVSEIDAPPFDLFHVTTGERAQMSMPATVTGKISGKRMLSVEEFTYLRGRSTAPLKATLSSPITLNYLWHPEYSTEAYSDPYDLFRDAAAVLRNEALELARLGCEYIQIDAPELIHVLADENVWQRWLRYNLQPERIVPEAIDIINSIADPIPGVTFGLHVCRANASYLAVARGGYGRFVSELVPRATNFSNLLLEYDDERSGDFAPLADIPDDKKIVLGLVSTKRAGLENGDEVRARIHEAARYTGLDRLALSTQCGFASMESGNDLTMAQQADKLRLVVDTAREVWS
ncbi:5-methyltetrahydropteroyltriglutamate--homocysteine methyltransferase [Prauserella marina]|uniref:5-methyltetrahydropteroyltriglutamate--homocysteine methyltransferase n=1 Tax=Prauserella marina TaxID=530584 RepID=A0A1G6XK02_9PSEU|nr:cobalamin-independent methionine synthase II family protein [Prauserella marina]PWV72508.1 5-methyltetrahydropteroyltriglutamate--homocysteine methyltransferase [Prauserella marina]SDD78371.1 5-methyltetrahydropteroyltriglutamate--homocysteine methyltransferase [Prauserella marina]